MNAKTGEIVALGSSPSFDPNIFAKIIRERDFKRLSSEENGKPLFNRAIQAGYPTGSTFKLITAVAALEGGIITPDTPLFDGGSLQVGGVTFNNAGGAAHGTLALRQALTVSSDVFFYRLGLAANTKGDGLLIQDWAHRLGLGRLTGIDLPAEGQGLVPTPEWRNALYKKKLTDRPWSVGDNINLVDRPGRPVGDAAPARGRVRDGRERRLRRQAAPRPADRGRGRPRAPGVRDPGAAQGGHRPGLPPGDHGRPRTARRTRPGGTSTEVFAGFNIPVAGKTGTAEKGPGRADQSWYAAITYPDDPQYVVVATDEAGGFGAERAAPDGAADHRRALRREGRRARDRE